jgi:hypothetical protein
MAGIQADEYSLLAQRGSIFVCWELSGGFPSDGSGNESPCEE